MVDDTLFRQKAPGIMNLLMADFPLAVDDTAAILGNIGHECMGFRSLHQIGGNGFGWPQWDGSRRTLYEAYCARHGYDPLSDTANYKFMFVELKGSHRAAIPAVKNAVGLEAKVKAFELVYERAGVKAYESRNEWARKALDAYNDNPGSTIEVADTHETLPPAPQLPSIPSLPPLQTDGLDLYKLLPVIIGVLTMIQQRREQAGGRPVGIMELLTDLLHLTAPPTTTTVATTVANEPIAQVQPPKPPVLDRPGVKPSLTALLAGIGAQGAGAVGAPVGDDATTVGFLTTFIPLASTILSMAGAFIPAAGVAGRLLGAFASPPKK